MSEVFTLIIYGPEGQAWEDQPPYATFEPKYRCTAAVNNSTPNPRIRSSISKKGEWSGLKFWPGWPQPNQIVVFSENACIEKLSHRVLITIFL